MKLALSTNWNSYRHESADVMLDEICELGFDSIELSYGIKHAHAQQVRKWIDDKRINVTSVHAFCPSPIANVSNPEIFSICDPRDFKHRQDGIAAIKNTADYAASVGAKAVVLHAGRVPINKYIRKLGALAHTHIGTSKYQKYLEKVLAKRDKYAKPHLDTLCRSLEIILPHFEQLGIKLGLENLPTYDGMPSEPEYQLLFESFDSPALGYWHDIGHGQVRQNLGFIHHAGVVSRFSDKIVGLHIHDVIFPDDDHRMPPKGKVNFRPFKQFLNTDIPLVIEPSRGTEPDAIKLAVQYLNDLWYTNEC